MIVGDKLDAGAIGHDPIDIKGLLLAAGYVMPQGSVAKLPHLPGEVEAQIALMEADRERYDTLDESKAFICQHCATSNFGAWRVEVSSGTEFLVCGDCHRVVEVR